MERCTAKTNPVNTIAARVSLLLASAVRSAQPEYSYATKTRPSSSHSTGGRLLGLEYRRHLAPHVGMRIRTTSHTSS